MTANPVPARRRWALSLVSLVAVVAASGTAAAFMRHPSDATASGIHGADSHDEPAFSGAEHLLLWGDAFDVVPARSSPDRFGRYVTLDARLLQVERGSGVGGTAALRIVWSQADTAAASCADDSRLIEASFPPTRELVVSYWVRYSPGFVFDWQGRARCAGNAKKLFLLWAREGSRFVFISENGALGVGSDHDHPLLPQNMGTPLPPRALADGAWHRVTLRIRQGSTPSTPDGAVSGWIDGALQWRHEGIVTHNAGGYYLFKMPATFNAGSPVLQTEWMDELRIWRDR